MRGRYGFSAAVGQIGSCPSSFMVAVEEPSASNFCSQLIISEGESGKGRSWSGSTHRKWTFSRLPLISAIRLAIRFPEEKGHSRKAVPLIFAGNPYTLKDDPQP